MVFDVCYYCFTVPIKASSFEHSRSRCVTLLLSSKFSRELNSNMPCCISREVIRSLNSLENLEARRQLSMPELPPQSPSPYFAPLLCLLRIIASFIMPLTREICQFYVSFMSVLCQFSVYFLFYNLLIIKTLYYRLCRMSVVFAIFIISFSFHFALNLNFCCFSCQTDIKPT